MRGDFEGLIPDMDDSHAEESHGGNPEDFLVFNGFRFVHVDKGYGLQVSSYRLAELVTCNL